MTQTQPTLIPVVHCVSCEWTSTNLDLTTCLPCGTVLGETLVTQAELDDLLTGDGPADFWPTTVPGL